MVRQVIHPRDEIMQTMARIYRYRMTTTSGGNLSIRDDNGEVWISPARVDKGNLTRDDIVCVKVDGSLEGTHPPSSELPFGWQARRLSDAGPLPSSGKLKCVAALQNPQLW